MVSLVFHLTLPQAIRTLPNDTTINSLSTANTTINGNNTRTVVAIKNSLDHGKEILHDAFLKMDRGTFFRATIVLAGITCLILIYIGIKTFFLRRKRQPKRYTLITDPTAMEEPLFGAHDDDEEEIEDDTLFVRK
ncbi:unnamed protein product [Rotaria sp. Silwood2]|nr:unnamed protein product [Rotaria sp. Silwood2]CAF2725750.1 unnamed protein product [Rotaria sp. Silwood2]CAF3063755.1 unnamed protein product [Rotaria sp. Silwood2]CAF3927897.1 unnamed protein product [Rotaria sp. Silwood2]CAF4329833.1 unnamed protein product [Rotaria sp. Silwood2]